MGRLEVACRKFAILSGVQQEAGDYAICVHPGSAALQRKGTLAILAEPAGDHPSLSAEACRLAQSAIIEHYFADQSLGMTTGLVNALDNANTAVLEHNYNQSPYRQVAESSGSVAVQAGGVRTKKARVGLTAALVRPDGAGLYLSQLAPTQAYLAHNGLLSALPEPPGWQAENSHKVVTLRRVLDAEEEDEAAEGYYVPGNLPAPSLGSGTSVEADLIYRRIEPGDLLVMVSTSLSRHLDRQTAEELFSSGDADAVAEALYSIATEHGLAEAHACVLQFGVEVSSGVEVDYTGRYLPAQGEEIAANGGAHANSQVAGLPLFKDALKGPKEWFKRRATEQAAEAALPFEQADLQTEQEQQHQTHEEVPASALSTQTLLQRTLDIPPYKANMLSPQEDPAEEQELDFDGWEDIPPALDDLSFLQLKPTPSLFHNSGGENYHEPSSTNGSGNDYPRGSLPHNGSQATLAPTRPYPNIPSIFQGDDEDEDEEGHGALQSRDEYKGPEPARSSRDYAGLGKRALAWSTTTLRGVLPERLGGATASQRAPTKAAIVPIRLVVALGVVVLLGILAFSVLKTSGNQKQTLVTNYLQQAQQEEQLANQPGALPAGRLQRLQSALDKARQAVTADPQSQEAKLFLGKVQDEIDKAQGITRLATPKLLFDLDAIDSAAAASSASGQASTPGDSAQAEAGAPAAGDPQTGAIIVQGNDAYVLDKQSNRLYRCIISTKSCEATLRGGDNVGGQTVSNLLAITMRISSPVALDDKFVAYTYETDSSTWQAQPLGGAEALQQPLAIASYDGNLYLLGAKPGQVSKYISGSYGEAPQDWITDPALAGQLNNPVSLAIDGSVYVLTADGKIIAMQSGKMVSALAPKYQGGQAQAAPTGLYTNTDTRDLYLLRASDGSITRITKEGQIVATFKGPADFSAVAAISVDEGRSKIYLLQGRKVYEAILPSSVSTAPAQPGVDTSAPTPPANPTAEP